MVIQTIMKSNKNHGQLFETPAGYSHELRYSTVASDSPPGPVPSKWILGRDAVCPEGCLARELGFPAGSTRGVPCSLGHFTGRARGQLVMAQASHNRLGLRTALETRDGG